jgi:DNA-binding response OmpR family regulator
MPDRKPSILIVDDEPVMVSIVRDFLVPRGYTVFEATNGTIGLEVFKERHPDIVILDVKMPGIDGNRLKDLIRKMVETVRIIMTSGHTETIESYITSDEIFLKKPFHIKELMEALKTAGGNSLV